MPNVLEVQIVGDVSALEKSLKQAESLQAEYTKSIEKTSSELKANIAITNGYKKAIEDLNNEYKEGSISSKDYSKQLANLKRDEKESAVVTAELRKELTNLKKEQKELGGSFDTAAKKTANGGNALMQFSRIAQDAPFGIMGIGNNITATTEAFSHLQKQTGSTGAALKAVASSMLGSGGILLAVSLVTTGLTYMSQKGISVGDVFDKLTGKFDENAQALSEINKEAAKNSAEEIFNVKALVAVAQDKALSDEERLTAVKKLQSEYPAYFGNLTQEKILNGDLIPVINDVSKALRAKAKMQAISGKLSDLAVKELDLREKETVLIKDYNNALVKKNALEKKLASEQFNEATYKSLTQTTNALSSYKDDLVDIQNNLKGVFKERNKLEALGTIEAKASISLESGVSDETKAREDAVKAAAAKAKKEAEAAAKAAAKAAELRKGVIPFELEVKPVVGNLEDLALDTGQLDEFGNEINRKLGEIIAPIGLPPIDTEAFTDSIERALQGADVLNDGIGSSFGALGNEIAGSLQTGISALDAFTGSVIHSLADIASAQLAQMVTEKALAMAQKTGLIEKQAVAAESLTADAAVSTGNAVTAATETAAASGPAAAFVLPALVGAAIGFIAASFAGIKFAHGGVVPGGSYTGDKIPAMLNSGEAVMNSQQQANTLMAIANGNSNSLQGNRQSSNFTLETKLRGSDLLLGIKREERKR